MRCGVAFKPKPLFLSSLCLSMLHRSYFRTKGLASNVSMDSTDDSINCVVICASKTGHHQIYR